MSMRRRTLLKVIVLGDSGVGKTSLMNQYPLHASICCRDISNEVFCSNILKHTQSFATSVPSVTSQPHKASRRVPLDERRAMLESFTHEYRMSNAGKFPSFLAARKEFGGSHYVIRRILQEVKYKFKMTETNKKEETQTQQLEEAVHPHFDVKKEFQESKRSLTGVVSESPSMDSVENLKFDGALVSELDEAPSEFFEAPARDEVNRSTTAETFSHQIISERNEFQPSEEVKQEDGIGIKPSDHQKEKSILRTVQQVSESEDLDRNTSEKLPSEKEMPVSRSKIWGNLKSLADGIINFWK